MSSDDRVKRKSHLAAEYCHSLRGRSPGCWSFWIHASSSVQFDAGLRELADELEIAGRENAYADILRLVGEWLSGSSRHWLLVLDDVDPQDGLSEPIKDVINAGSAKSVGTNVRGMVDYLAKCPHGQIIMTTRHQDVALHFTDDKRDVISIGPMEEADASALFQSRAGEQHETKDVERLVAELGCIPQATTYAAAFIGNTEPQYSNIYGAAQQTQSRV